MFVGFMNER